MAWYDYRVWDAAEWDEVGYSYTIEAVYPATQWEPQAEDSVYIDEVLYATEAEAEAAAKAKFEAEYRND